MRYRDLVSESSPPKPLFRDLQDALEHASNSNDTLVMDDFTVSYIGYLTVDELHQYDDIDAWLEVDTLDDLEDFRNGFFSDMKKHVAPIVVIKYPDEDTCREEIGDGRGRINYAHVTGIKLHTYVMVHRDCIND